MRGVPLCFDSKAEYELFLQADSPNPDTLGPAHCWDCTPEYQAEMKAEGRCMRPNVRFVYIEEDGELARHGIPIGEPNG